VQVCVRVTLPWDPEHLDIWNLWVRFENPFCHPADVPFQQTTLTSLFRAFSGNPCCRIGLCITYLVYDDSPIPLDQAFCKLPDGTHTLRTELAPTCEADVRAFLNRLKQYPIPQFELFIKHGKEGYTPRTIINAAFLRPPSPSGFIAAPAEWVLDFHADRKELGAVYRRSFESVHGRGI
jgi:hypothetical protein